ncbi:SDR family oxidoreductase [Hyalangium minutum]|uniref:3-oxoacyl-[acyl-carrier protein] reductase n=1 Tax=Hyalangium minutum TaxID=394096 RepID=A0A085W3W0_9BACT|nr:SDR family oxidoreductase [Hyalangium minutum]KFE62373.1 3-oxoacyl-[acyl-carrier protein] reductase [Hyalangium minutum]
MPYLRAAGGGSIANVFSIKAKELGPDNIRVNTVLVGMIESARWARRAESSGKPPGVPLGRIGRAEEFADVVAFLVSPRATYVSGTAINVDGRLSDAV